ncbi:MAG: hypothetical protein O7H40_09300 [Gammaproteobacteria bacterium]|nr:hypothetical protein [Gammaproteobacteria bacterium]
MAAALTIAVLFGFSFIVVRIAAVAMRITGLSENVARFQCISALTGAGFTTSESELIVNYPIRRRVIVALMILGNLGLASTAATLIVSFASIEPNSKAVFSQALLFILAIGLTLLVMLNKAIDRVMCAFVEFVLRKTTSLGKHRFHRLLQLRNGNSVAEHVFRGEHDVTIGDLPPSFRQLTLLAIRGTAEFRSGPFTDTQTVSPADILICYGSDAAHESFEDSQM